MMKSPNGAFLKTYPRRQATRLYVVKFCRCMWLSWGEPFCYGPCLVL